MKKLLLPFLILIILLPTALHAQIATKERIETEIQQNEIKLNIHFLASDEFRGRDTGTNELEIAARYIATWFEFNGVEMADGHDSYFQDVPIIRSVAPDDVRFVAGDSVFVKNRHLLLLNGFRGDLEAPVIFRDFSSVEEITSEIVEGKMVVSTMGFSGESDLMQQYFSSIAKHNQIRKAGGAGLIELYNNVSLPWMFLVNYLTNERFEVDMRENGAGMVPHLLINAAQHDWTGFFSSISGSGSRLEVKGDELKSIRTRNVIGVIRGTDPNLRDEYVMLSAHYDHVGVIPGQTTGNYIFNGTRDNAVGTAAILSAARYLAKNPPRRSIILAAWTAEEQGLLGSMYYAENPIIPLNQTVFNLNIDGAGYNDTTKVTIIGYGKTDADPDMKAAATAFGLEAIPDPAPEQNLFERSDNVSLAMRGVPAPTYSLGFTSFDEEINRYYHQVTDEPHTVDYDYITKYIRSFVKAAVLISNRDRTPFWVPGDSYEQLGIELYTLE